MYLSSSVQNGVSPVSPLFQPLQACLAHLQFPRKNISYKELIGEGAFGEVYLVEITGLVRSGKTINLVAVKQLRCKLGHQLCITVVYMYMTKQY